MVGAELQGFAGHGAEDRGGELFFLSLKRFDLAAEVFAELAFFGFRRDCA